MAKAAKSYGKKKASTLKPDFSAELFFKAIKDPKQKKNVKSNILLLGKEPLRLQRLLEASKAQLKKVEAKGISSEDQCFYGGEMTNKRAVDTLSLAVHNMSLFATESEVTILNADSIKVAYADKIAGTIASSHPGTQVFISSNIENTSCPLLNRLPRESYTLVELAPLDEPKLIKWIAQEAKRYSVSIQPGAAAMLAKFFDDELYHLSNEIQRLSLLLEPGEAITEAIVRENSTLSVEHNTFQLIQLISAGKRADAIKVLQGLLANSVHPLQITALLQRCYRMMIAEKGSSGAALPKELTNYYFKKNLGSAGRRYRSEQLLRGINILADLDIALKGSKLPDEELMKSAIVKLATA